MLKVLEHANKEVVGYYQKSKGFGFVIPDNQKISKDIFIPQGCDMGAVNPLMSVSQALCLMEARGLATSRLPRRGGWCRRR